MSQVTEVIIIFKFEPVSFFDCCARVRATQLLHGSMHISCPFCCSVCGLSLFIVWSPSDQVPEQWKWLLWSDKRSGIDLCTLWHSSVSTNPQDGRVIFLSGQPSPHCGSLNLLNRYYNHIRKSLSHLENSSRPQEEKEKKMQNTQNGWMQMYKLSVTTLDHRC